MRRPAPPPTPARAVRCRRTDPALLLGSALALYASVLVTTSTASYLDGAGDDQLSRWQEVQYFLRGVDPAILDGALAAAQERARAEPASDGSVRTVSIREIPGFQPDLVVPTGWYPIAVYPPWTYPMVAPLHAAPQPLATWMFGAVSLGAYLLCVAAAVRAARGLDCPAVLLVGAGVAAMSGFGRTLEAGNYGTIVMALLWGSLLLLDEDRPLAAGLCLGLACLKPTLGLPFLLVPLVRRAWWPAAGAAATVLAAFAGIAWWVTGVDPVSSLVASQSHVTVFVAEAGGFPAAVASAAPERALPHYVTAALVAGAGAGALALCRGRSASTLYAVASVTALAWTYHRQYDYVVLSFVLTFLAVRALGAAAGRGGAARLGAVLVVFVVGAGLWLPGHVVGLPALSALWMPLWLLAVAAIVRLEASSVARRGASR